MFPCKETTRGTVKFVKGWREVPDEMVSCTFFATCMGVMCCFSAWVSLFPLAPSTAPVFDAYPEFQIFSPEPQTDVRISLIAPVGACEQVIPLDSPVFSRVLEARKPNKDKGFAKGQ